MLYANVDEEMFQEREREREAEVVKKRSNDEQTQVPGFMFNHGD